MNTTKIGNQLIAMAVAAAAFGLLTIASGGRALFGGEAAQQAVGAAVDFVLWFNFVAGFAYVGAAVGLWARRRWAVVLAAGIALATLLVFAALGAHVASGGAYEVRTIGAMVVRSLFWVAIAWFAYRALWRAD